MLVEDIVGGGPAWPGRRRAAGRAFQGSLNFNRC
ncbi:hypothetical protein DO73_3895 [Burkholderia pseudomallei]|nr:hypothetical protein DO73_3895 [Burkholderia pseudomallei]